MGQIVTALMLGVSSSVFESIDDWDDFTIEFEGPEPRFDETGDVVGYRFAVGRDGDSNDDDIPGLEEPVAITAIEKVYAESLVIARARWSKFADFVKDTHAELTLEEPVIYIVPVEVG